MLLTPPTPTSLVSAPSGPPAPASRKTSKRHRGLNIIRTHLQNLSNPPQSPPETPTSSDGAEFSGTSPDAPSTSGSASALTPPSLQRPQENQSVGYFPDLSATQPTLSGGNNTLPPIEEGVVSDPRSPGQASTTSSDSSSSGRRVSRSMARRRTSFTSAILGSNNSRSTQRDACPQHPGEDQARSVDSRDNFDSDVAMANASMDDASSLAGLPADQMPTIRFIPHQDPRSNKPSLAFTATSRTLPHENCVIRVGRYSERDSSPCPAPNAPSSAPVGFKSKVVSRRHCEFWCSQGQWYVKDVKSSSGTFLNHIRLSQPSTESRPFPVNDGDIIQLGMDFRGGEESIFRCVKIRIECNRAWQKSLNNFNMATHKQLRALSGNAKDTDSVSTNSTECSICLMPVAPCQSLFVAPCSHVWHFKCIRPILNNEKVYPQFLCPNCRAVADLEADIEDTLEPWEDAEDDNSSIEEMRQDGDGEAADEVLLQADATGDSSLTDLVDRMSLHEAGTLRPLEAIGAPRPTRPVSNHIRQDGSESLGVPISPQQTPSNSLRDPRAAMDTLEGVVTPRNEAGPFVFDGSAGSARGSVLGAALAAGSEGEAAA